MKKGRKHWICVTDDFARKYPALLMFFAVCTVCIPGQLLRQSGISVFYTTAAIVCGLTGIAFLCFSIRNVCYRIVLPGCLAACSLCFHSYVLEREPLLAHFRGEPGYGEGIFRITDDAMTTGLPFLKQNRRISAQLLKYRHDANSDWLDMTTDILLILRKDYTGPELGYGDTIKATGMFLRPAQPIDPENFNYRKWLENQKIFYEFRTETEKRLRSGSGVRRMLYDLRNHLLNRICRYIPDPEVKALVPGLFFGLRGTDPETLENFRSSGMIHIISVSGTHISLFALVLFLLLAPLPYQFRYSLVILFTFLYAESTGMRVPAFRAFMMFAMFCGLRMFRMYTLSFNTLFLAATLLTLLDPMAIFQAGFQFSFLAVAALLMLSAWQKMHVLPQSERMLLTPSRMISANYVRMSKFKNRFVQVIFSCIIAWLISLPLTLYHQGLWSTGTPAANFLSTPFITLSFLFFTGCCIFCLITPLLQCSAWLLTLNLKLVCAIAESFAGSGDWMTRPALWLILLFTGTLLFFLCSKKKAALFLSGGTVLVLLLYWHWQQINRKPEILFFSDGTQYTVGIITPQNKSINVIALPDKNFAFQLLQSCNLRQIKRCNYFVIPETKKKFRETASYFCEKMPVLTRISKHPDHTNAAILQTQPEQHGSLQIFRSATFQYVYWGQHLAIRNRFSDGDYIDLFIRQENYAVTLHITRNGKHTVEYKIPADGKGIRLIKYQ